MHGRACITTTTISLERSAYELLKAHKRPDESFSEEVQRLLGGKGPRLTDFLEIFPAEDGKSVANAIQRAREVDLELERKKLRALKRKAGRRG